MCQHSCQHSSSGASKPLASAFFWYQQAYGVSILLVPASLWRQHFSILLVPASLWRQHSSGTSKLMASAFFWYQQASGVSKVLVPARSWCQQSPGASKPLVSAFFWHQQSLWCQQASGTSLALEHGSGVSMACSPFLSCHLSSSCHRFPRVAFFLILTRR